MIARAGSGWQTVLADLALILFMVTGSALAQSRPDAPKPGEQRAGAARRAIDGPSPQAEPVAVWHAGRGSPPLEKWLAATAPRARLTVTVRYGARGVAPALDRAQALASEAGVHGLAARIVVEPGSGEDAVLAYDAPPLARGLQDAAQDPSAKE